LLIGLATFEHLPVKVGGLSEAATALGEALARQHEVMVFMPSHGIHHQAEGPGVEEYARFRILVRDWQEVEVYETRRRNVRLFLLSNQVLDNPQVYVPRENLMEKVFHFAKSLPGLINVILKREGRKPEVLHLNDWHCLLGGALARKYFRIPLVYTIHRLVRERVSVHDLQAVHLGEFIQDRFLDGEVFLLEPFGGDRCDYLTTVSFSYLNEEWSTFFGRYDGKVTYVWNGNDYSFWNPAYLRHATLPRKERRRLLLQEQGLEDGCLFFNVGRLDREQKGIDVMLRAAELILEGQVEGAEAIRDGLRLVVLGAGDSWLEEQLKSMQERYPRNVKAIIGYLGREATREFYGAADFCLVPSNFEPFGLVQLEAMCMGCVPIGTRVGGIKDTVLSLDEHNHQATGMLVPPRDPAALGAAMVDMARLARENPNLLDVIRHNGRVHVIHNFSWERAAARYVQIYRNAATMKLPFVDYGEPY